MLYYIHTVQQSGCHSINHVQDKQCNQNYMYLPQGYQSFNEHFHSFTRQRKINFLT